MADTQSSITTPKQQLVDLINATNGSTLTIADVDFSDPVAGNYTLPEGLRNARVTMTAAPGSEYTGSEELYYNRLALSDLGPIGIITPTPLTGEQFLQTLSSQIGVDLLAEEFESFAIPVLEIGIESIVTLVAKDTAIKWYGEVSVGYAFTLPVGLDVLDRLINVTLPAYHLLG